MKVQHYGGNAFGPINRSRRAVATVACQPPPGAPQPYPDDGVVVWPGTFQLLDDERTARVVYWRNDPGATGPVLVESIITIEPVTGR